MAAWLNTGLKPDAHLKKAQPPGKDSLRPDESTEPDHAA
jgi:hypothetical protein